jgi:hypothetical protein
MRAGCSDQRQQSAHFTLPLRTLGVSVTLGGCGCEHPAAG